MKKNIIKSVLVLFAALLSFSALAQQVNSQYFLENVPTRHYFNPAFQPINKVYISLPVLGYTQVGLYSNSFSIRDVFSGKDANGKTLTPLSTLSGRDDFYNKLSSTILLTPSLDVNLLGFGFRTGRAYWTFSASLRADAEVALPKDLFGFMFYGTRQDNFDLKKIGLNTTMYGEAALGYSFEINDKWTVGGKLKGLYGIANVSMKNDQFALKTGIDEWVVDGYGNLNVAAPFEVKLTDDNNFDKIETPDNIKDWLSPSGLGAGIDLGVTYRPIESLALAASVTDLGFIKWNKQNAQNYTYGTQYTFEGLSSNGLNFGDFENLLDSIGTDLEKNTKFEQEESKAYTSYTTAKLNVSAEYAFLRNTMSIGVLSRTLFYKQKVREELTAAFNVRPINQVNLSLSYSILDGRFSNLGAGVGLRTGIFNWHVSMDYIPFNYVSIADNFVSEMKNFDVPIIPYNSKGMNVAFGMNLVFGNKNDKDRDGVPNKYDLCPDTPRKVKVDKAGCPLDDDGDGVPDYLDQCPDTPVEAYGFVDANGCPMDTDGDGVPDYLDKCNDTPAEAYASIDKDGCPIDSDGDGVPDYLDECPDTLVEANGMVDERGCLLDSDGDGVPDYLDKCPDTPEAAYPTVDENGCPRDTDGDGVPDYLDKCPNTPVEAYRFIDEKGCFLDTDGDGVPDYLDYCPKTPGVKGNNGCPEVKKEVRNLFQKALQGIQFESGKAVIKKSSNTILDQIAKVMEDNSTYKIEIEGHTDSSGNAEANQVLSENRAEAVRKYLADKGIAESRMTAVGYGDTKPVAPNTTAAGRTKNRRVEFIVSFEEVSYE